MRSPSRRLRLLAYLLVLSMFVPLLSSCGSSNRRRSSKKLAPNIRRVVFEHEFREKYKLDTAEIQRLQFYTSHAIHLRHETNDPNDPTVSSDGRLIIIGGKKAVEEIDIAEGAPCIATQVGEDWMEVSFKDGVDTLKFVKDGDAYVLAVEDGVIEFENARYTPQDSTDDAQLTIEESTLYDQHEKLLYLPGRVQGK